MSGTSIDAIDAALIQTTEASPTPVLVKAIAYPVPPAVRSEIELLCQPGQDEINRLGQLDRRLGTLFAEAVLSLLRATGLSPTQIRAIGSHGQTVRHQPKQASPFTLQIGDPNTIAYLTGITTVADFRRMDMAADGQGAPLVPAFHHAVFAHPDENRIVVNIGGMANITVLTPGHAITGFDTGPGNVLMDSWVSRHRREPYDLDGSWAASGQCVMPLLDRLLSHPYFAYTPGPKSTGRETFHVGWLDAQLADFPSIPAADVQRTLLHFTARSITDAILALEKQADRVILCGGGSHNLLLIQTIAGLLPDAETCTSDSLGIPADWVEAMAFAWLAKQRLDGRAGNVPSVTGAREPCLLGAIYQAR